MQSDEILKQAMAELREPVPEELERRIYEIAGSAPSSMRGVGWPWQWIVAGLSFVPLILVLSIRYAQQIVETIPVIKGFIIDGLRLDTMAGIPTAVLVILIVLVVMKSYRETLRLGAMVHSMQ